ncbi:MAG: Cna B-type domain-containing protein [bacterium]|nr:Cna B-type domain-containing protein [bacterium]
MINKLKKHKPKLILGVLFLSLITIFTISAQNNAGKIEIIKEASKISEEFTSNNLEYGRFAKVNLNIKANPYNEKTKESDKLDIVLVLDKSKSMKNSEKLKNAKDAAKDLVNTLMDDKGNVKIGVVEFATTANENKLEMTTNKKDVINFIDSIKASGGTNLEQGIVRAKEFLNKGKRKDAKQIVIILTDGVPTYFNYNGERFGTGSSDDPVCIEYTYYDCTKTKRPSEAAKDSLDLLKQENKNADVYTIAFGSMDNKNEVDEILKKLELINPKNTLKSPLYKNYKALSGKELKEQFEKAIEESVNKIGKDSILTDIIPKEFTLTSDSKKNLIDKGIEVIETLNGTTLKWEVGNLEANKDYSLSYIIKAKDNYHGSIYTNEGAFLKTTVLENNPYYDKTNLNLEFNKPAVDIPVITNDDHYKNNSTYIGYSESVINGSSILENDLINNKKEDIKTGNDKVSVTDEIEIITNKSTIKNKDGTYSIYKNGLEVGKLNMKQDGTFTFLPLENITGEVTFDYKIVTKINQKNETDKVISNTSTVTLNILNRQKINVPVVKTWVDDNDRDQKRPDEITVKLLANNKLLRAEKLTKDDNWTYTFTNLYKYETGYENDENHKINYTIEEVKVKDYETSINGYNIKNSYVPEVRDIKIEKIWNDNNNQDGIRPNEIIVKLFANNKLLKTKKLTKEENWTYTFTNLYKYENGEEINYTVQEEKINGYETLINNFTITNTHIPEKINITGEKRWVDQNDKDGLRPNEITINLCKNTCNNIIKQVKLTKDNDWIYKFENLDKYENGKKIEYLVTEQMDKETEKYYQTSYDEDNPFIIINTHSPKDVTISGKKVWKDENNKYGRPSSITLILEGKVGEDSIVKKQKRITKDDNWTYEFTNLPEYNNGKIINYTVSEEAVKDYDTTYDGYDIMNTYNPETITIKGTKSWDDNDNQDGIRPDEITVILYDHLDNEIARTKADKSTNWTYSFENIVRYADNKEINYKVKEVDVNGYETVINNFDITNKHAPEKINIKIKKSWNDNNNQDGIRPESITVKLYKDGILYRKEKITKENNWTYIFTNLDKYENGKEIKYEIVESEVKGYKTSIRNSVTKVKNEVQTIITNTHNTKKINIKITKIWKDNDNEKGLRPSEILVDIYKGSTLIKQIKITEKNGWVYILKNLDKYENGKEIIYKIKEHKVKGYNAFYDGYTIINKLIEKNITVNTSNKLEITPPKTGIKVNDKDIKMNVISLTLLSLIALFSSYVIIKKAIR